MNKYLLLGILIISGMLPSLLSAQSAYYWSDGKKINLSEDHSAVMIHFESDDPALETRFKSLTSRAPVYDVDFFAHKKRAVVQFQNDQIANRDEAMQMLGLKREDFQSVSFAWRLDDGFQVFHTHEVVLQLTPGNSIGEIQGLLDQHGARLARMAYKNFILEVSDIDQVLPLANKLQESGLVTFAHPDLYAELSRDNDPLFGEQFQMHNTGQTIDGFPGLNDADCNALEAWGITLGSSSITVAVIDDGVENHEDLDNTLAGFTPANNGNGTPNSSGAHGQACAGIIAANHNGIGVQGVAPNVNLITANIFFGGETTTDLANAITWAKNNGADVMSNSWGYNSCTFSSTVLTNALNDANSTGRGGRGCVIAFSSGNSYGSCVNYPANVASVIAVGAFGNDGIKSSYSNAGPTLDIAAPSNDIGASANAGVRTTDRMGGSGYASGNYTTSFGGTSAACPVVAGVLALVLSVDGNLTSAQVKNIIYTTAKDFGSPGFDNSYGNGAIDAFAAVQAAGGGGGNPGGCTSTVSSFPYSESFESGTGAWTQGSGDDFNWTRRSGGTPSSGTGPSGADDGSFYMYVEASSPNFPSRTTIFQGPCFDLSGLSSPEFTFSYHMLGSAVGTLSLQASTDGTNYSTIWSLSGNQSSNWNSATVNLGAYAGQSEVSLRYVGTTASSWQGDMCIDGLGLDEAGSGGGTCSDTEVTLTLTLDNYPGETTWSLLNDAGGTVATGGPYTTAGATVTETFCLADGCYDFVINDSYGDGICCAFGNGSYDLTDDGGNTLASGGAFTSSETTNFCLGSGPGSCPALDLSAYTFVAYGGQDQGNNYQVQDGGATVFLQNNTWKYISFNYTVTANTILSFDFRSTVEGEIHGLGFDVDNSISSNRTFQVHGTQNWGISNFNNYSGSSWTTYTIPVGNFFTGSFDRLTFVADHDASPSNGNAYFRNVKVYEQGACVAGAVLMNAGPEEVQLGTEMEATLSLYPNPAREMINFDFGHGDQSFQVQVMDLTGKVLLQKQVAGGSNSLSIENLPQGIYMLQIKGEHESATQRFVRK